MGHWGNYLETVEELPRTHVNLQIEVERIFGCNTFARPLFYSYPGGLRFELSESGVIDQFLTALRKAMHQEYLLDHDRPEMDSKFATVNLSTPPGPPGDSA